jgi:hypothetical protein
MVAGRWSKLLAASVAYCVVAIAYLLSQWVSLSLPFPAFHSLPSDTSLLSPFLPVLKRRTFWTSVKFDIILMGVLALFGIVLGPASLLIRWSFSWWDWDENKWDPHGSYHTEPILSNHVCWDLGGYCT